MGIARTIIVAVLLAGCSKDPSAGLYPITTAVAELAPNCTVYRIQMTPSRDHDVFSTVCGDGRARTQWNTREYCGKACTKTESHSVETTRAPDPTAPNWPTP